MTADRATAEDIAARPEVVRILDDGSYKIPDPIPGDAARVQFADWNIALIGADQVWNDFTQGEGIVIANVDTGVDFMHEALVRQYRGNLGGGSFDHGYNWFDPARICSPLGDTPCDNAGHGTHTMGTMVGGDGPGSDLEADIGVAPGARWIAAKGCEDFGCSFESLLRSGEWILAPTDAFGNNPRPELRPHVVNNSWGGWGGDPFYQAIVDAWRAAGIFPAFSNGNSGPGCGTAGSPGDYANTFAAGATDINDFIADFSSRGPSVFGVTKPDVSAPGVDVLSSVPGGYAFFSGTSMASPHVAGTVALLWASAPTLIGDYDATANILRSTARDLIDVSCGGDELNNNVYGDGRIDAYSAVSLAPRNGTHLTGTVADAGGGAIAGARVEALRGDGMLRQTYTNGSGAYDLFLPLEAGTTADFAVTVTAFGFLPGQASLSGVAEDIPLVQDFNLDAAPSYTVSGTVVDDAGLPIEGATVRVLGTPIPAATTLADGSYVIAGVPEGQYDFASSAGACNGDQAFSLYLGSDTTLDFALPAREDAFGYRCKLVEPTWYETFNPVLAGCDDCVATVDLGFAFNFYGQFYSTAFVSSNGNLNFQAPDATFSDLPLPDPFFPNAAVYPFWDDLFIVGDFDTSVLAETQGEPGNRVFVVEYRNVSFCCEVSPTPLSFQMHLHEGTGQIEFVYASMAGRGDGSDATIGIENEDGTIAFQYGAHQPVIHDGLAVRFFQPPFGVIDGVVTDRNDGLALAGATVRALRDGNPVRTATTGPDGSYHLQLALGTYTLEVSAPNYVTDAAFEFSLGDGDAISQDFALATGRGVLTPSSFDLVVVSGQTKSRTITLTNTGSADLTWDIRESGGRAVPAGGGGVPAGNGQWLYQLDPRPALANAAAAGGLARPKAYRWTPVAPAAANVLVYADDYYQPAPNTPLDDALRRLGMAYTAHYDGDWFGFEADLQSGAFDLVLVDNENYWPDPGTFAMLADYVANGGRLGFNTWTMEFDPGNPLFAAMGAQFVASDADPPDPVLWWEPGHPVFNEPEVAPELINAIGGRYIIYGQNVEVLSGFEAVAGRVQPGPVPGQAALIVGNEDRTIFRAFGDGAYEGDTDADGKADTSELWSNIATGLDQGFVVDVPWLSESVAAGTLSAGATQNITLTIDARNLAAGVYQAKLTFRTNAGRVSSLHLPIRVVVPAYQKALNSGGAAYTDLSGEAWLADRVFSVAAGYGYVNARASIKSTTKDITGTQDDPLYKNLRVDPVGYRFTGLPPGTYQIELLFAEVAKTAAGAHQYDITAEDTTLVLGHDVAYEVGSFAADSHSYYVPVNDGQLDVRFLLRAKKGKPEVGAIRVTHRPDR